MLFEILKSITFKLNRKFDNNDDDLLFIETVVRKAKLSVIKTIIFILILRQLL